MRGSWWIQYIIPTEQSQMDGMRAQPKEKCTLENTFYYFHILKLVSPPKKYKPKGSLKRQPKCSTWVSGNL